MKNFRNLLLILTLATPGLIFAQPPEDEVAPTAPEFNIEVSDVPSPDSAAVAPSAPATTTTTTTTTTAAPAAHAQVQPTIIPTTPVIPITPATTAAAAPKDDSSDKYMHGITLSPTMTIKPLGYNGNRHQNYFELQPAVSLDTTFQTAQKREVSLNAAYNFYWDEFLSNRSAAARYFEHDLTGGSSTQWTDAFSTAINGEFDYSLWASENREFAVYSDDSITGTFKITNEVSVTTGYRIFFFNDLDSQFHLDDGTLPSDGDDIRSGNVALSGTDAGFIDPANPNSTYNPTTGNTWFTNNGLQLKTKYVPISGTTVGFDYEYVFATFSNVDSAVWHGHWLKATLKQNLPWKGASVAMKDEVRLRNYTANTNADGSLLANFRNRLSFTIDQSINEFISAEFWYRWELSGNNGDNYASMSNLHELYLGFTFGF